MADSVVSFLLQNLSRLLNDEIKLLSGVEEKVNSLYNELKFIDIFLKSSEGKRSDEVVKEVVSQIRDVAYKAEDVVDTYVANIAKHKRRNILSKLFHFKEQAMVLHKVNNEINKIKSQIDDIYKNKDRYGIGQGEFQSQEVVATAESLRERRRVVEEEDVVGLVHDSSVVIKQLKESDPRLKVVSIIGMGGLGKTTLARKIYNNNKVRDFFDCFAWGYVSNDYRPKELFLSLLNCLRSSTYDCENLSEEDLKKKVAGELKEKRYLVVLDDIWNFQVWDKVKGAFPDDKTGSRILITSRLNEVAHYTGATPPYNLPVLHKNECWVLFCNKIFRGQRCPSDLEPLGRSIVETCGGLPLAIVVLAGLVAAKEKSQREWKRIKDISWSLTEVMDILKLSYDNLPPRLKPCFLYFGIYPEDYEISVKDVIQLWIAEGFIHKENQKATEELEDIGDRYLDDMVDRNLVQVAKRRSDGGVKTCRIHDLLRDFCISEGISNKFLEVCTKSNINTIGSINPRRLSLHCKPLDVKYLKPYTRSVFAFHKTNIDCIMESFQLTRVLYFNYLPFSSQPNNLKRMVHLRYLKIHSVNLPTSIIYLSNLETLYVHITEKLSSEIWKLKRLRHLYLRVSEKLPEVSGEIVMENLQTLWLHTPDEQTISKLQNVMFPRLRKLTLADICKCYSHFLEELPSVHSLTNLQCLNIASNIVRLTNSNAFPSNLTKIILRITPPVESHIFMNTLGALPNLQILKLVRGRTFFKCGIYIASGKFMKLQVFHIRYVKIDWWKLEKDVMSNLQHLILDKCFLYDNDEFSQFPEQLLSLTSLRVVHLVDPWTQFASGVPELLNNDCKLIIENAPPTHLDLEYNSDDDA